MTSVRVLFIDNLRTNRMGKFCVGLVNTFRANGVFRWEQTNIGRGSANMNSGICSAWHTDKLSTEGRAIDRIDHYNLLWAGMARLQHLVSQREKVLDN